MKTRISQMPKWLVVVIGILVAAGFLVVLHLSQQFLLLFPELPGYGDNLVAEFCASVYALILLHCFGFGDVLKEKGAGVVRGLFIGGFMTGYCLLQLVAQAYVLRLSGANELEPWSSILIFTVTMFLIGLSEELAFRGILLNLFLNRFSKTKFGILMAIILDGVLFGALHLMNYFSGVDLESCLVQALTAALLGIIFAAIYARSRNIWIVIIAHALTDFAALMSSGLFGMGNLVDGINQISSVNLIAVPVLLIPCLVLLRPSKLKEMENRAVGMVVFDTYEEADSIAITSLILGILGILTGVLGYGIGLAIVGLLGSIISRKIKPEQNGIAVAGMVTSIIGIVIAVFVIAAMMFLLPEFDMLMTNFS